MERLIEALRSRFACRRRSGQDESTDFWTTHLKSEINPDINVDMNERKPTGTKNGMCSFMVGKMLWCVRLSRLFGCLFISNVSSKTLKNASTTWKSPYTIYAAVWLWIGFVGHAIDMLSIQMRAVNSTQSFTDHVTFAFRALIMLKVLANYACFCLGSANLLEFLQSATAFEKGTSFVPAERKKTDPSRTLFDFTLRAALWVSLVSSFFAVGMIPSRHASSLKYLPVGREALTFCGDVAFFFYDFLVYVTMTRCSEVLVQYLKCEVARLEACRLAETPSTVIGQSSLVSMVATVRVNFCKIKSLKTGLNNLCGPAIVTSTACLLMLLCASIYNFFMVDKSEIQFWLTMVYMAYCIFCLVDMAFVSEDLGREARKLKRTAKAMAIVHPSNEYLIQVRYLHNIIEPEEMCFTGASFFRLDRALLLTVAGAVITFGVILVQTGSDLSSQLYANQSDVST